MHTEMCTVHVPTAAVEEMFSYVSCVDVSGNFLLPTCNANVTHVYVELVRNILLSYLVHVHSFMYCINLIAK